MKPMLRRLSRPALAALAALLLPSDLAAAEFRAGASEVDISPPFLPVRVNGGFLERSVDRVDDPLYARCLVLDDGKERLAIAVVDSCMVPREVCDEARRLAAAQTGLLAERITIAATHTHSAPGVMDFCLGSRADPAYTAYLPSRIAEGIRQAESQLQPARIAWSAADAGAYTACRRWITRPDSLLTDPFGERSVRAMMHPGHENPAFTSPSGPIDPWLSLLRVDAANGQPLALLANFSMHYFGSAPGVSADYFGRFARAMRTRLAPDGPGFVAMMSQGTSGDLWWGDYSGPKVERDIDSYTAAIADLAETAWKKAEFTGAPALAMAERRIQLDRRTPSAERLDWARALLETMAGARPQNQPEVYAEQALYLAENRSEELVLQALRIGSVAITAIPNEVYALTGLKLKARCPLPAVMNLSLANGASGYIPPPEQHRLGGYTTWPARTAGLETEAEPKIVEHLLELLESVAGQPRRAWSEAPGNYAAAVRALQPAAFWRLGELDGDLLADSGGGGPAATISGNIAFHLPGIADRSQPWSSHALQLAGGWIDTGIRCSAASPQPGTLSFWFWSGMPNDALPVTGTLLSAGEETLVITGSASDTPGRLELLPSGIAGLTDIQPRRWTHIAAVRDGNSRRVYLDGKLDILTTEAVPPEGPVLLGGKGSPEASFEGRLDEAAAFARALSEEEIAGLAAAGRVAADSASRNPEPHPESAPLDPDRALAALRLPPGFSAEIVAAEPLIADPVAIDWGPDGVLWVAEMADYPLGLDGQGAPGGRVRRLTDTDGDGRYDQSTLFLDGLPFPTGVKAWKDGVLVTAAPEILFAADRDGDGRAEHRETLYRGFIEGNQQLRVNGLRWGLDNWIHCANGGHHPGFGTDTAILSLETGQKIALGSRDLRFHPETGALEPLSGPSQFGRCRDDWGNWFGVQNSFPLWHYVLDERYLRRNAAAAAPDPRRQLRGDANPRVFPASSPEKRFHSFENAGRYTSACGPSIYRDDLLFPAGSPTHAFTCEPFHNLVQHHLLRDDGVSFSGERAEDGSETDFFASSDRWCRPVMTRTGPDGALAIVDMYRYIIEHPDWLPPEGREELAPYFRLGEGMGRIYRVYRTGQAPRAAPLPASIATKELSSLLGHPNGHVRDQAQELLVQRADPTSIPSLTAMAREHGSALARLHALAALDGLGKAEAALLRPALHDAHPAIRALALRLAEGPGLRDPLLRRDAAGLRDDPETKVRFQLALTLGEWNDPGSGSALADLALEHIGDPFFRAAIESSAVPHRPALIAAAARDPAGCFALAEFLVSSAPDDPEIYSALLRPAAELDQLEAAARPAAFRLLAAWLDAQTARGGADPGQWPEWLSPAAGHARAILEGAASAPESHAASAAFLGRCRITKPNDAALLREALSARTDPSVQDETCEALLRGRRPDAFAILLDSWKEQGHTRRSRILDVSAGRPAWAASLLEAVRDGSIPSAEIDPATRQRLRQHADPAIQAAAIKLFPLTPSSETAVAGMLQSLAQLEGSPERGEPFFLGRCAVCHRARGTGGTAGPDLDAITDRSAPALLAAILVPNDAVEPSYLAYEVRLRDGDTLYGRISGESAGSLRLTGLDGNEQSLPRASIESVQSRGTSLMPEGLAAGLSPQDLADLIAYLQAAQ
ncbi:MAG TPA: PVC-type heme-binding CxxCH protein [Verrucomicrobiales bacterium]|nr:PVC-type heme-binding CxxCH protein [Verrucomicrobiales bacterium]